MNLVFSQTILYHFQRLRVVPPLHQGGILDMPNGNWYCTAFVDINSDSADHIPVLSSLSWTSDRWPVLDLTADNTWSESLPYPC